MSSGWRRSCPSFARFRAYNSLSLSVICLRLLPEASSEAATLTIDDDGLARIVLVDCISCVLMGYRSTHMVNTGVMMLSKRLSCAALMVLK